MDESLPTVVVTHNAPSNKSSEPQHKNSRLAPSFASNLENFINENQFKIWIHGHMHYNSDYTIGDTRIISNPRGYDGIALNPDFSENLIIELKP